MEVIRTLLEIPSNAKQSYDERLGKMDAEIHSAVAVIIVTPSGPEEDAKKVKVTELVKKRDELLKERRRHFYVWPGWLGK